MSNLDPSQNVPLTIVQGATFTPLITWYGPDGTPIDLTNYSANMQFRTTVEDEGDPIIEISTDNGGIVIGGTAGTIVLTISSTTTSALTNGQKMVFNLFLTSPANIIYSFLAGVAYVQGSTIR